MKKGEGKFLLILVALSLIIILGVVIAKNKVANQDNEEEPKESNVVKEEFVQNLEDGTRLNTSKKLSSSKTIDGIEISEIQVTEKNNETLLLGTLTKKDYYNITNFN